jgi:Transposase IS116/IS110/IS902 family
MRASVGRWPGQRDPELTMDQVQETVTDGTGSCSGERQRLGRVSRQGDHYLRTLLVNGARSALMAANRFYPPGGPPLDRLRLWALGIEQRRGLNKATVALANKLARIIWATWRYERPFDGNWVRARAGNDLPAPLPRTSADPS